MCSTFSYIKRLWQVELIKRLIALLFGQVREDAFLDKKGYILVAHPTNVLHDSLHVFYVSLTVVILIEDAHVSLVPLRTLLILCLHVYILLKVIVRGPIHFQVPIENIRPQIVLIISDQELQTDGVAEFLKLAPIQSLNIIFVELCKDSFELTVLQRIDHTARKVDHDLYSFIFYYDYKFETNKLK